MTDTRWAQVKALFQAAVERPAPERAEFLAAAAGGDELLRREVESLLRSDDPDASLTNALQAHAASLSDASIDAPSTPLSIGPYHVTGLLGTGGMGEVFRARDSKLHRDVALKLLPHAFAFDPDRLARFRREARALAALNHPHIGAIYGLEESDGRQALVLEFVDGATLAERVAGGPLPIRETLTLAGQIAGALGAAHEKGIVHRDLKPSNVKVTPAGVVKVLDFGLAKTAGGERPAPEAGHGSRDDGSTHVGAVVGTAAYMSPEQARGLDVDTRTDIWAFGCVLFEMLSGRKAFASDADSDSTEKVLAREPDWTALPARTPAKVRGLLRRCLEKDPARRLQTIAEAHHLIDRLLRGGNLTRLVAAAAVAVAVLVTAVIAYVWSQPAEQTDRSDWVQLTRLSDSATQPALSRDGSMLAFIRGPGSTLNSRGHIYVKALPDGEPVQLTDDGGPKMSPMFSPDGTRIAYSAGNWDTWVVPVAGGAPSQWLRNASGLSWPGRGEILFSENTKRGMAIVTSAESRDDPRFLYYPTGIARMAHRSYRSPDGRWVLLAEMNGPGAFIPCRLIPFDGSSTGRQVGPPEGSCTYAGWSPDGRWMYFSAANPDDGFHLWRQGFPDGVVEQLTSGPTEEEGLAVSPDGRSLITSVGVRQRAVWLHDAAGERQVSLEGNATAHLLSADGQRVYYLVHRGPGRRGRELRVTDMKSRRTERLLPSDLATGFDVSQDGRIVAAVVTPDGGEQLWLTSVDGRTAPRRIPMTERTQQSVDDSGGSQPRFGRAGEIIFRAGRDKGVLRVNEDGSGLRQLTTHAFDLGRASPDGAWITGMWGSGTPPPIWLFSLTSADRLQVLQERGGGFLRWAPDGSHLYISRPNGSGHTYVLPLAKGSLLPAMPPGGFRTEAEIAAFPGVQIIPYTGISPGPTPDVYTFSRETVTRNIFQIPIR